ncbi:hypothetical protein [Chlorobium limicola]|uniref:CN hydrolase domain-containing protein n=1 Tax=Chlorobium limicola TaxID=1092 RepID=A0A101JBF7_CHLLI|nr:hypothetical protein [Chlorobium limicola]KUL23719.1 hypothetical protein ASB62_07295 [Chlorobium limicola]
MDKVVEFINTGCFREALARLCRLARQPVEDGRTALCNWEPMFSPSDKNVLLELLEKDGPDAITRINHNNNPLLLLQALDEYCHRIYGPDTVRPDDRIIDGFGTSKVLSIYPGFGGGKLKQQFGNLSFWLKHHRVIPLDNTHGIPVDVCDIPPGHKDWTTSRFESAFVKIGIVQFTDNVELDIDYTDNNFFICRGISDGEKRLDSALDHIRNAKADGVHLLIMPELTITPNIRATISEQMMDLALRDGEDHELSVPIIVPGSFHEQCKSKWRNHAEAICGLDGTTLFGSDKRERVTYNGCGEMIESSPTPITCLTSPLGLIGMTICRDLFMGNSATVLQSLPLDWLFVPSMSDKLGPHKATAKTLYDTRGTIIAVANQQMPDAVEYDQGFVHHEKYDEGETGLTIITIRRTDTCLRIML